MAILKVARLGHPILRQKAAELPPEILETPEIQQLIDDMIDTMREYDGIGLAATQVHEPLSIFVIEIEGNPRYPNAPSIPLTTVINPKIEPLSDDIEFDFEGCLSVPDIRGEVPRYAGIKLEGLDRKGGIISIEVEGFVARAIQHETDHLNGLVFLDSMEDMSTLSFTKEYQRYWLPAIQSEDAEEETEEEA
jgi:peptide deformylase